MEVGLLLGGALLALACGILNGSWVVPTKANAPKVLRVTDALPWEAFWLIFNISLVVLNAVVTINYQGSTLFTALSNTGAKDMTLIVLSFFGWGLGATGFGLSVKRVGVALGTALVLAVATIVGTILPVVMDFNSAKSQLWFLFAGVLVACAGFAILGKANLMKDHELSKDDHSRILAHNSAPISEGMTAAKTTETSEKDSQNAVSRATPGLMMISIADDRASRNDACDNASIEVVRNPLHRAFPSTATPAHARGEVHACDDATAHACTTTAPSSDQSSVHVGKNSGSEPCISDGDAQGLDFSVKSKTSVSATSEGVAPVCESMKLEERRSGSSGLKGVGVEVSPKPKSQFWVNIGICVFSGVLRAGLNVGLVLGEAIEKEGRALGSSEVASGMAVWFVGFNMCALPGILFSSWLLTHNGKWSTLACHERGLTPRRFAVTVGSAATWVVLLHFYGVSTVWLGSLGNAIAWPLLLASTILSAQFWSQAILGEWKGVSRRTKRVNAIALSVLILSVIITAAGVLVDEFAKSKS